MTAELVRENEIEETCEMIKRAAANYSFAEFYPEKYIESGASFDIIKGRAHRMHFYVLKGGERIIGYGKIFKELKA